MNILALDPWMGGSHSQLLEAWAPASRHSIELLGLPPRHWKWRMSAGAWALARQIEQAEVPKPDALWVSSFVDLPQLRGFLPADWARVPTFLYFHENQLTYPRSEAAPFRGDMGPAWAQILSCLAADGIAFNSSFHLEQFRGATAGLMKTLPKPKPSSELRKALQHASVIHPGIDTSSFPQGPGPDAGAPLRVAFNHRWEYDKGALDWLNTVSQAIGAGAEIQLVLLGERSQDPGPKYQARLAELAPHILVQGHLDSRDDYARTLGECDLVVSCAIHEFYGMAVLEGVSSGCTPLAPDRLAYPEVLGGGLLKIPLYDSPDQRLEFLLHAARHRETWRTAAQRKAMHGLALPHDRVHTFEGLDLAMDHVIRAAHGPKK
ncbi:MAG: DUF3524 domain-containing protein [Planctomycetota bacterium]|nr:DUF3524 domain-containing protein [Planctomycetota bacterium]